MDEDYERLANALDKLPNGFPRTSSGVEILVLKKIFSLEEAKIASQMGREKETISVLAERFGLTQEETETKLNAGTKLKLKSSLFYG